MPGLNYVSQAHSRVANVNNDIGGVSIDIYCKIPNGKILAHLESKSKVLPRILTPLSAWGESTAQAHNIVSNFNIDIKRGCSINISYKISKSKVLVHLLFIKSIARCFSSLKCLGGILHIKFTTGCQMSSLIFDFFWGGGAINIAWKIAKGRQSSLSLGL